jgi:hypothetical protein
MELSKSYRLSGKSFIETQPPVFKCCGRRFCRCAPRFGVVACTNGGMRRPSTSVSQCPVLAIEW